jgi:formylglycine-generating enzyme required for sulfatase activity
MTQPVKIFYCYAREDETCLESLKKQLMPLKRGGFVTDWYDRLISPGTEWEKDIEQRLEAADLVLLLISPDFMASDYCYEKEMRRALKRHENSEARVIPIIVRPVFWQMAPFAKIQVLPRDGCPVTQWPHPDDAWEDVVRGIYQVAQEIQAPLPIQFIHGWSAEKVQALQRQTARALEIPVEFRDSLQDGGRGSMIVVIPGGRFLMGSPEDESRRNTDERQHEVAVAHFAIGKYAVTFEEYDRFAAATGHEQPHDEGWGRGRRPVINVSWFDAVAYTQWLSQQTGQTYRLPTEAEWEYACRAGTTTPFYFGATISTEQANYNGWWAYVKGSKGVYREKTVEVGQFPANAWGLHDMHGDVWEWTCSEYDGNYGGAEQRCVSDSGSGSPCVLRGGSWFNAPEWVRGAARFNRDPHAGYQSRGFRLARTLAL